MRMPETQATDRTEEAVETREESTDIAAIRAATKREIESVMRMHEYNFPPSWTDVLKFLKTQDGRKSTEQEVADVYRKKAAPQDPNLEDLVTRINLACAEDDIAIEITPHKSGRNSQKEWTVVNTTVHIAPKVPQWLKKAHQGLDHMRKYRTSSATWQALLKAIIWKYEGVPEQELEEIPEIRDYQGGVKKVVSNINEWGLRGTDIKIHMRNDIVIVGTEDEIPIVKKVSKNPERELEILRAQRMQKYREVQTATLLAVEYGERLERAQRILARMQGGAARVDEAQKPRKPIKEELDSPELPQNDVERLQTATKKEVLTALKAREITWTEKEKNILGTFTETRQAKESSINQINRPGKSEEEDTLPLTMLRTLMNLKLAQLGLQLEVDPDPAGDRSENKWNLQVADTVILYEENGKIRSLQEKAAVAKGKIQSRNVKTLLEKLLYQYGGVSVIELEKEPTFQRYKGGLHTLIKNANNQNLAKFGLAIKNRNGMVILKNKHEGILAVAPPSENISDDIARELASIAYLTQELKAAAGLAAKNYRKILDTEKIIEQIKPREPKTAPKPARKPILTLAPNRTSKPTIKPTPRPAQKSSTSTPRTINEDRSDEEDTFPEVHISTAEPEGLDGQTFLQRDELRIAVQNEVKSILKAKKKLSTDDLDAILTKLTAMPLPWNLEDLRTAYLRTINHIRGQTGAHGSIQPTAISKLLNVSS